MSETNNTNRTITLEVTPPQAVVTLTDPMYVSTTASTNSPASDTHRARIDVKDGEVHLHFHNTYLTMSLADWHRVAVAVAGIEDAAVSE